MRAIFLIFFKREIISYKVKRSFEGSGLNNAQFQCGISQILFEETNLWPDYEEFDGKISILSASADWDAESPDFSSRTDTGQDFPENSDENETRTGHGQCCLSTSDLLF